MTFEPLTRRSYSHVAGRRAPKALARLLPLSETCYLPAATSGRIRLFFLVLRWLNTKLKAFSCTNYVLMHLRTSFILACWLLATGSSAISWSKGKSRETQETPAPTNGGFEEGAGRIKQHICVCSSSATLADEIASILHGAGKCMRP